MLVKMTTLTVCILLGNKWESVLSVCRLIICLDREYKYGRKGLLCIGEKKTSDMGAALVHLYWGTGFPWLDLQVRVTLPFTTGFPVKVQTGGEGGTGQRQKLSSWNTFRTNDLLLILFNSFNPLPATGDLFPAAAAGWWRNDLAGRRISKQGMSFTWTVLSHINIRLLSDCREPKSFKICSVFTLSPFF